MAANHHGPVICNLKRLLMCNRRRMSVSRVDCSTTPPTNLATVATAAKCMDSSPDSLNCQSRLVAAETKRRRSLYLLRVTKDFNESDMECNASIKGDDSDSVRTLCSDFTEVYMSRRDTEATQSTAVERHSKLSCRAEICCLETTDHCDKVQEVPSHEVRRTEDLVITEYRTECQMFSKKPKMVVNDILVSCHRQLNAELIEDNWQQTVGPAVNQIKRALRVSNNLTNFVQESKPRTSPNGDSVVGPDEAQFDAAECKRPLGDAEAANCVDTAGADATDPIQSSQNTSYSPENPYTAASSTEAATPANKKDGSDRIGILSSELCVRLCLGLHHGDDLIESYLKKRGISETVRARHRQRCGFISDSMVDKILRKSAKTASGVTTDAEAAGRLPKTSSAPATDVGNHTVVLTIAPLANARFVPRPSCQSLPRSLQLQTPCEPSGTSARTAGRVTLGEDRLLELRFAV